MQTELTSARGFFKPTGGAGDEIRLPRGWNVSSECVRHSDNISHVRCPWLPNIHQPQSSAGTFQHWGSGAGGPPLEAPPNGTDRGSEHRPTVYPDIKDCIFLGAEDKQS